MGCCISKCKPKNKHSIQDFNHAQDNKPKKHSIQVFNHFQVQDKLVISQAPKLTLKTPIIPPSNKISPSPPSPTTSSSSVSSFTCTSNSNTSVSSGSSLSSGSSSILTSKDRSFSNEFLWSCVKENPHIIRINSIKEYSQLLVPPNVYSQKLDSAVPAPKQPIPQRVHGSSTPQKRVRSNSTSPLNRQKSFRREPERINSSYYPPIRTLRSPSPSRRFNGESGRGILTGTPKESCSKRTVSSKVNAAANSVSSSLMRKENLRPVSPYINSSHHLRSCLKNKETCIHRISSKIDEVAVEEALANHDSDAPMEDIDNPLISLDCFIFL
ncbi:hypothetical protein P3X46_028523 [Hevea brasiliensis]|uniref:Uncharacterized protein n=2 Tax=Hevea brasiliensis TaxID=3981 RepID=A0ABQ9KP99_HEVBR|nr:hypothetical protein P3X46_028523 [Hevea brasiliensis]